MTSLTPIVSGPLEPATGSVIPVVLCGGSGTRLWPLSRRNHSKQHVAVLGGASPFQRTLERLTSGLFADPIVIGAAASRYLVAEQASEVGVAIELALEPEGRDTLAAVALAAMLAARREPLATVLVVPSDHLIPDREAFARSAAEAAFIAAAGRIVVLGIEPDEPSSAYGYIARGAALAEGGHRLARFVEKPSAARAEELIAEGCLWNAGMFCFRADVGLSEIARHAPDALEAIERAIAEGRCDDGVLRLGEAFLDAPKISFDHAVMEKTDRGAVAAAGFRWSDIGDWKAVWEQGPRDSAGVVRRGRVHARDVADSYLRSDGRLLCVLGVKGLAVVETPDAVLVAPIERSQEVKALVDDLEAEGIPEAHTPARVSKPWGWFQTVDLGDRFRVKRLVVMPGKQMSLQWHRHRAEHWVVVRGTALVTCGDIVRELFENQSIDVPIGAVHRLSNPGHVPVEIVEVQTGTYLEEDDIVRIEDDFGRL
ncbi:MAG: mannose-1-phosphate guanylyltransferase/mannose-6-phosphate isomerase [Amaricoccus sp.]